MSFRKIFNQVHLWTGLIAGIFLFILCATGTIYVFAKEITRWVDSDKFLVQHSQADKTIPVDKLIAMLEEQKKDSKVTFVQIPEGKDKAWLFTLTPKDILARRSREAKQAKLKESEQAKGVLKSGESGKPQSEKEKQPDGSKVPKRRKSDRERIKTYLVNPYTGQVQGDARTPTSKFFITIMGLHRWLLLDHEIGRPITGIATLLFILIELTGIILWLPAKLKNWGKWNSWKAGFTIKFDAKWKRINHDLHNTLGFYTFLLVTLMALTGLCFSFEWFRNGVEYVFGAKPFAERKGGPLLSDSIGTVRAELDGLVLQTSELFSYNGDIWISLPKDSSGVVTISKMHNGFIASAGADKIHFDQYNGKIVLTERFAEKRFGEQVVALIYPLHVGEVFGTFTKIVYFIFCLIATSLPITGTIIWFNKKRKKTVKVKSITPSKKAGSDKHKIPKIKIPLNTGKSPAEAERVSEGSVLNVI